MQNDSRNIVGKVAKVLRIMVEDGGDSMGVRKLATALDMAPSSAHRVLNALVREGFLDHDQENGAYSLSMDFIRLAHLATDRLPLQRIAVPRLRELVEACNETALLGVYDAGRREMMFTARVESSHKLRYVSEFRQWMPVYAGASGLGIMAFLPPAERQAIISQSRLAPLTDRTITEPYRLENELEIIRDRGYASSVGQRTPGAVAVAAPIFGTGGEIVGDVVVTLPELRFDQGNEAYLARLVMSCAQRISEQIGGKPVGQNKQATEVA
jgi:DNA-binding IclR family transcriptional regulator